MGILDNNAPPLRKKKTTQSITDTEAALKRFHQRKSWFTMELQRQQINRYQMALDAVRAQPVRRRYVQGRHGLARGVRDRRPLAIADQDPVGVVALPAARQRRAPHDGRGLALRVPVQEPLGLHALDAAAAATTVDLQHLIAEARGLANDHPCVREHLWRSTGGRHCSDCGGSKAVFESARCGECDYGDREPCGRECDYAKVEWEAAGGDDEA